jgi:hypothetical protein
LEFPEGTEEPVGFKLDVSFNHLQTSDAWLDEAITDFVTGLSIDLMEYRSVLAALTEDSLSRDAVQLLQYGGLGFDDQANVRFNVYLAPASLLRPG